MSTLLDVKEKAGNMSRRYYEVLFKEVIPFWEKFSVDEVNGGYFTCLCRDGKVFDEDKFVWLQAREIWMFSKLVISVPDELIKEFMDEDHLEVKKRWMKISECGVNFLFKHAFEKDTDNVYFSLTRTGEPLIQPYNIFSDCFTCMAFSQFYNASVNIMKEKTEKDLEHVKMKGLKCFENIESRKKNPKGVYLKNYPGTRNESSLAVPMIDMNICLELLEAFVGGENKEESKKVGGLSEGEIYERIERDLDFIFNHFLDESKWLLHETYPFSDTFNGRLINPGHTIEAIWFILQTISTLEKRTTDEEKKKKFQEYIIKCEKVLLSTLEFGWDQKYGGIFYFMDCMNKPLLQLEWDQKLWWVHFETLISCLMFFIRKWKEEDESSSENNDNLLVFWKWFEKVHEYVWNHFYDGEQKGEFWGYLNRRGEVLIPCKGGKWKGAFHVPRALWMCGNLLQEISKIL